MGDNIGDNTYQGSAYIFVRSGSSWNQVQKLTASDGAAFDTFGYSVAISGDNVVLGAPNDNIGFNSNQGSAYMFVWTTIFCCF
jgi:FG-GAP repeat